MTFHHADPAVVLNVTSSKQPPVLLGDYISLTCNSDAINDTTLFEYMWTFNSSEIPSETSNTLILSHISPAELGTYTCDIPSLLMTSEGQITITSASESVMCVTIISHETPPRKKMK